MDELIGRVVPLSELPRPSAAHAGVSGASGVSSSGVGDNTLLFAAFPPATPRCSESGDMEAEWLPGESSDAAVVVVPTGGGKCVSDV